MKTCWSVGAVVAASSPLVPTGVGTARPVPFRISTSPHSDTMRAGHPMLNRNWFFQFAVRSFDRNDSMAVMMGSPWEKECHASTEAHPLGLVQFSARGAAASMG